MTEAGGDRNGFAIGEAEPELPPDSKDYWDIVFEQLGRRRMFKVAMAILVLLYGSAVYAPILGNDRPYVLDAVNYKEYGRAQRTLYPVTLGLGRLLKQGEDEYLAGRTEGSELSYQAALGEELDALRQRLDTMRRYLPETEHRPLDELEALLERTVAAALAGEVQRAVELHASAKDRAKRLRAEYVAVDPTGPASEGKTLVAVRSYPLLETITAWEAFFMVLWAIVLTWPLWNRLVNRVLLGADRDRIRRHRRTKWLVTLGISAAAASLWGTLVGGSMTFAVSPYKEALSKGEIVATHVVFPPFPMGFAETRSSENFRPPTWAASSEVSGEGYYVRGPRAPEPDPITGYLPPANPIEVRFGEPGANSPWRHPLGTDGVGRDMLVRLLWGGRISLSIGLISAALLVVIGSIIGSIAGYYGGWIDLALSRLIEIVICFPALYLILFAVALTDPNEVSPIVAIIVIIALVRWTGVARLARGEFLRLRELEFVIAARALGFSARRTIFRHILPNAMGPILVAGAFSVAAGILTESAISFLGFGVQHPVPSWGSLVNESRSAEHWWIQLFPGLLIFVTVACYNLVGDAFRDALDPKMKREA